MAPPPSPQPFAHAATPDSTHFTRLPGFTLLDLGDGFTAVLGPSGCGKSTLAGGIAGLVKPASGTISVNGRVFRSDDPCIDLPVESRGIGFVFQSHRLFPHLTVRENLLFGRRFGGRRTAVDQDRLIEVLGIAHLLSRRPDTLSGGESQRVALGRAILAAETLLIMDEPLARVSTRAQGRASRLLRAHSRNHGHSRPLHHARRRRGREAREDRPHDEGRPHRGHPHAGLTPTTPQPKDLIMKLKPLLISLAAVSALAAGAANAAQVIVTTGAGYVKMVDALAALYQKETGVAVEKSFGGNIGQMLAQVKHGSGVNVVISDEASLEKFHDALAPDARRLGDTPLVLVWRKGLELKRPEDIALDSVKTVASPNPKAAVYGRSAAKWLKATGLDAKVAPKLQVVGTVPQVYSYVTTGNMDAGFVNLAVLKSGTEALGGHAAIRDESAVVHMTVRPVRGAEADADVKAFMDFLASEKAKPVLRKFGIE